MDKRSKIGELQLSTPAPFGDVQKRIQDKVAEIRARVADLKTKLPFTPPGILPSTPILQRTSAQRPLGILSGNLLKRPLLMRSACPECNPQNYRPPPMPRPVPNLNPAIVDIPPNLRIPSGAAVAEDISPTRLSISIAT